MASRQARRGGERAYDAAMDPSPQSTPGPLWTPSPDRIGASAIDRFRREVAPDRADTVDLWRWTVDEPAAFWRALWTWCDVIGDPGTRDRLDGADMRATTFLPDATLNVAANLLADRPGAGPDSPALITTGETGHRSVLSRAELRADRSAGAAPGAVPVADQGVARSS